jgi:membrane protein DedA with SNARE-associated domain
MPAWLEGRSFAVTATILFLIVLARAQATYWAGRGAMAGALHTTLRRRLTGPRMTRAIAALNRWGLPLITVSFITIGFQTVVNAAAGLTRMHWGRYTAAMLPGCVAWAVMYATIGFAAFTAWMRLGGVWQWVALAALVVLAAAGVAIAVHVKRRLRAAGESTMGTAPVTGADAG